MTLMEKFESFNDKISLGFEWLGLLAFVFMMMLTTVDVFLSKLFQEPIPGSIDLMMMAQLIAIAFVVSTSYIGGRHISVEFFMPLLPKLIRRIVACIIQALVLYLFFVMTWQLFVYGHELKTYHEVSATIRVPLYPFTYATAVAFIPACLVALAKWIQTIVEVFKNEP